MSEYPIGEYVNRNYLVSRDRLQAALADATLVIQTGINGGTMHAVNAALAAGKTVYAVEYKVTIPEDRDAGNKWLICGKEAIALRSENQDEVLERILKSRIPAIELTVSDEVKCPLHQDPSYPKGTLFNN